MRPVPMKVTYDTTKARRPRHGRQPAAKPRVPWGLFDRLEPRTLLAVTPAPLVNLNSHTSAITPLTNNGNLSSPQVAIDPQDPNILVTVATLNDPDLAPGPTVIAQGSISLNGGRTWTPLTMPNLFIDPLTSNPAVPFPQATDVSVAFDDSGNFYVVERQHEAGDGSGAIVFQRYSLNGTTTPGTSEFQFLYAWENATQAAEVPTLSVDTNQANFSDPTTHAVQADKFTGNIYVTFDEISPIPANVPPQLFNPDNIFILASSDGGQSFGDAVPLNDTGFAGRTERATAPRTTVSQGNVSTTAPAGQITTVWDDYGTDATATPVPFDRLMATTYSGGTSESFGNGGQTILPATGAASPFTKTTTTVPIVVTPDSRFSFLSDLSVTLGITGTNLNEFQVQLVAPNGTTATIFNNAVDEAGNNTNLPGSLTGTALGVDTNGNQIGTTFSNNAVPPAPTAGPAIGVYRPPVNGSLSAFSGLTATDVSGTWFLKITDFRQGGGRLVFGIIQLNSGLTERSEVQAATSTVLGAETAPYPLKPAASPNIGIGPAPVLASDNTLGSFSPHEGRLYMAYVDRNPPVPGNGATLSNPADNTDIYLTFTDDGGINWSTPVQVNSDFSPVDGYTESTAVPGYVTGRPQFEPSIAVDQSTGTVVMSWYDTRDDASRARVATYLTTSIDGGQSFSPQTFANSPNNPTDAITGKSVLVGPVPDNESAGNPKTEATFSFGYRQGLAVENGQIHAVWSGNLGGGPNANKTLNILTSTAGIAAGPRVISGTEGPVTSTTIDGQTFNNTFASDGTQQFTGFTVQFDRPVDDNPADAAAFGVGDVTVLFHSAYSAADVAGTPVGVASVTPLDPGPDGATTFFIRLQTPQSGVGTYSYSIGPNIIDRIRQPGGILGNPMDQNANGTAGQGNDVFINPAPLNGIAFQAPYDTTTLPIIVPGPHLVTSFVPGVPQTADNLVLNGTVGALDVVFDRDMNAASFTPAQVLSMMGPSGAIGGPFTVLADPPGTPAGLAKRTFQIGFPTQELSGTYTIELGTGIKSAAGDLVDANQNAGLDVLRDTIPVGGPTQTVTVPSANVPVTIGPGQTMTSTITGTDPFVIQGLTLALNITDPYDPDLAATLTRSDGVNTQTITLFNGVGNTGSTSAPNFTDTVFDDNAKTPIQNGGAPFFGRFNPQQPLGTFINTSEVATWTLTITNKSKTNTATLNSWSLSFVKPLPSTGLGEPVIDNTPLTFRIFTMDPTNPLSSNTWTAVGPAAIGSGTSPVSGSEGAGTASRSGRIGGIAVDPSDPSGNTVYVAGASGGIWKTTDFLTTNPLGPTYVPLTDFGPTFSLNMGGIAVFARNGDPNQSIVFGATGEGDTGSPGVGFVRSMDGGATWTLLDSTTNVDANGNPLPINSPQRDHIFDGSSSFKILVDPRPTPSGGVIVYAAMGGPNGGVWRSVDTGNHWQLMLAGTATDLVLDQNSGTFDAISNPTGNLRIIYAALQGQGVFISPNQGQVWNQMLGGVGDPLIQSGNSNPPKPIPVTAPSSTPNGAFGRIVLAQPSFIANRPDENTQYEGWLYAAVATAGGDLQGIYVTKDFGENWTFIHIANLTPGRLVPTNNINDPNFDPLISGQGNYDLSLAVDPVDPNVVYLGGSADGSPSGLLRIDIAGLSDAHSLFLNPDNSQNTGLMGNTADAASLISAPNPPGYVLLTPPVGNPQFVASSFTNLLRDPNQPFLSNATIYVNNTAAFNNTGSGATWLPFDTAVDLTTDQHRIYTFIDPLTGLSRLILGDDQGIWTALDNGHGQLVASLGDVADNTLPGGEVTIPATDRNGNLQITQFYYGAAQPSNLAAQVAAALFYGQAQDDGSPASNPNLLTNGNIKWDGPGGDGSGVATDQTGTGAAYVYDWPCCGGNITDFFQVIPGGGTGAFGGIGRTFNLVQASGNGGVPDPQWPAESPTYQGGHDFGNFAVNPIDGQQIMIGSTAGRLFESENQGEFWQVIGNPSALDGTPVEAPAYGAPDPASPIGALDNFLYAGTVGGKIYVTFTGGGGSGNNWTDISAGLDGSTVQQIVADPTRGSHDAYAVTADGVYFMADSSAANPSWQKITGNLFDVMHNPFNKPSLAETQARVLTSIQVDWRYVIPNNFSDPNGPSHPMLYVSGEGGVYRSYDFGTTWTIFPDSGAGSLLNSPVPEGDLPNAHINELSLVLGNVDPTTGRPDVATGPNLLLATTYGRGSFGIRLAPIIFPQSVAFDPNLPNPNSIGGAGSLTGPNPQSSPPTTSEARPVFDGISEQSAFGNVVFITLLDLDNPNNPVIIGGFNPVDSSTAVAANETDGFGHFALEVNAGVFDALNHTTDGLHTIGIMATDQSGTKGNIVQVQFVLDTIPPNTITEGPAGTPTLDTTTDSGINPADLGLPAGVDEITNFAGQNASRLPIFDWATTPGEPPTSVVQLLSDVPSNLVGDVGLAGAALDSYVVATAPESAAKNGVIQITDANRIADGTHTFFVRVVDPAGNRGALSPALTVLFDTKPPAKPTTPTLDTVNPSPGGSATGGPSLTDVNRPFLTGSAEPGSVVEIVDGSGNILGPTNTTVPNVNASGTYDVQLSKPLGDGTYTLHAQGLDLAGNISIVSGGLTFTIDTVKPTKPTLSMLRADDTSYPNDTPTHPITRVTQPHLQGHTDKFDFVDLFFANPVTGLPTGKAITTVNADSQGNFLVQFPTPLNPGTYNVVAQARDTADNTSLSPVLTITIVTQGPSGVPTLALAPGSSYGPPANGITAIRQPFFTLSGGDPNTPVDIVSQASLANPSLPSLATGTLGANGSLTLQLPYNLGDGNVTLFAVEHDIAGNLGNPSPPLNLRVITNRGDYQGDGKSDPITINKGTSTFSVLSTATGPYTVAFGQGTLYGGNPVPIQADFLGNGTDQIAVFQPSTSTFYIQGVGAFPFGQGTLYGGNPIPVVADFTGSGKAQLAVFQPSTSTFFVQGMGAIPFGQGTLYGGNPIPVVADYAGAGKAQLAVFQPSTSTFYIQGVGAVPFGQGTLYGGTPIPVVNDYTGSGKAQPAVYQPGTQQFFIQGVGVEKVGGIGDLPVAAPMSFLLSPRPTFAAASVGAAAPLGAATLSALTGSAGLNLGGQASRFSVAGSTLPTAPALPTAATVLMPAAAASTSAATAPAAILSGAAGTATSRRQHPNRHQTPAQAATVDLAARPSNAAHPRRTPQVHDSLLTAALDAYLSSHAGRPRRGRHG
ncbi:MAG TPA: Ig-like domain-containing protein [Isosphaeraceae bacterium]|nr:Ig-like domain-containing protein [Isosphaeraceae bacterium]